MKERLDKKCELSKRNALYKLSLANKDLSEIIQQKIDKQMYRKLILKSLPLVLGLNHLKNTTLASQIFI